MLYFPPSVIFSKEYLFEAVEFAAFGIDIVLVHLKRSCQLPKDYLGKLPPHRQIWRASPFEQIWPLLQYSLSWEPFRKQNEFNCSWAKLTCPVGFPGLMMTMALTLHLRMKTNVRKWWKISPPAWFSPLLYFSPTLEHPEPSSLIRRGSNPPWWENKIM